MTAADATKKVASSSLPSGKRKKIEVIRRFLPPKLDEATCAEVINQVIAELGVCKLKDAGRVMSELKSRYPDRMDFARARRMICQQLA